MLHGPSGGSGFTKAGTTRRGNRCCRTCSRRHANMVIVLYHTWSIRTDRLDDISGNVAKFSGCSWRSGSDQE